MAQVKHILLLAVAVWTGSALEANGRTGLAWLVFFGYGSTELTPAARDTIREFVAGQTQSIPHECPMGAAVVGHVDSAEAAEGHDALGIWRAEIVARAIEEAGWPFAAVERDARGARAPLLRTAPGASEPQNRRVEVTPIYHLGDGEIECRTAEGENGSGQGLIEYACQVVLKSGIRCPFEQGTVVPGKRPQM